MSQQRPHARVDAAGGVPVREPASARAARVDLALQRRARHRPVVRHASHLVIRVVLVLVLVLVVARAQSVDDYFASRVGDERARADAVQRQRRDAPASSNPSSLREVPDV